MHEYRLFKMTAEERSSFVANSKMCIDIAADLLYQIADSMQPFGYGEKQPLMFTFDPRDENLKAIIARHCKIPISKKRISSIRESSLKIMAEDGPVTCSISYLSHAIEHAIFDDDL